MIKDINDQSLLATDKIASESRTSTKSDRVVNVSSSSFTNV